MRLGYMVAPWEILSRFITAKADAGSGVMDQLIVGDFFTNTTKSNPGPAAALQRKRDALGSALRESFGPACGVRDAEGGMYLWLKFPEGVDTRKLVAPALEEGIAFNPGPDWSADPDAAANYIRLCFALPAVDDIWEGVAKLAEVFRRKARCPNSPRVPFSVPIRNFHEHAKDDFTNAKLAQSVGGGFWIPAFAGMTIEKLRQNSCAHLTFRDL